ncbi:MAG: peroxiredoxin [Verrucomicrobia bacterium]|nr:peroxiredoxin [Verrucomicrobiota bacterium]
MSAFTFPLFGSNALEVGAEAPDLSVTLQTGQRVQLGEIYARGPVLLYFYPRASTRGCTIQACNLRDNFDAVQKVGMTILGVSTDDLDALRRFKEEEELPFDLISDRQRELGNAFGVGTILGMGFRRQTFLVYEGRVVWRDLNAQPSSQSQDALAAWNSFRGNSN